MTGPPFLCEFALIDKVTGHRLDFYHAVAIPP